MGNIQFHSESSAQKFGGVPQDYVPIHKFLDQTKLYIADWRHRGLLHNTLGIAICEQIFGDLFQRTSDRHTVCTRTIAEIHILEDMGAILTPGEFLREMPLRAWMNGLNTQEKSFIQSVRIAPREGENPTIPPIQRTSTQLLTADRAQEDKLDSITLIKHEVKWENNLMIVGCLGCAWEPVKPLLRGNQYISYYQQWVEHLPKVSHV